MMGVISILEPKEMSKIKLLLSDPTDLYPVKPGFFPVPLKENKALIFLTSLCLEEFCYF
jgi:hypothetical protein